VLVTQQTKHRQGNNHKQSLNKIKSRTSSYIDPVMLQFLDLASFAGTAASLNCIRSSSLPHKQLNQHLYITKKQRKKGYHPNTG
jgi:hypothetical protein